MPPHPIEIFWDTNNKLVTTGHIMGHEVRRGRYANSIAKAALLSVSYLALAVAGGNSSSAQTSQQAPAAQPGASQLPPVQIEEPTRKPKRQRASRATGGRRGCTADRHAADHTGAAAISLGEHVRYNDRHGRRLHKQHFGCDQSEYGAHQHPAVDLSPNEGFHQGPGLLIAHRCHPLCPRCGRASGRRQSRRARHSRCGLERELFRQRVPR